MLALRRVSLLLHLLNLICTEQHGDCAVNPFETKIRDEKIGDFGMDVAFDCLDYPEPGC